MLIACVVFVGLLVSGRPATAAVAARTAPVAALEPFGVNGGALFPDGNKLLPTDRHTAAIGAAGLRSVRAVAYWNLIEPLAPDVRTGAHTFDWRRPDAFVTHLARHGLRWDVILGYAASWASTPPGSGTGPPQPERFGEYAAAFAGRYGDRGTFWKAHPELPYVPAVNFQVWNEPNQEVSLTAMPAATYARLYLVARAAILRVAPHARVAVGGLVHSAETGRASAVGYLNEMFDAVPGLHGNVDAVGFTIYRQVPTQVMTQVRLAREALDAQGERHTPIDVDETGWATRGGVVLTDFMPVTEAVRAADYAEVVSRLAASDCGVAHLTPYAWVTEEDNQLDAAAWLGIAVRDTGAPRPSGQAYVDAASVASAAGRTPGAAPVCGRPDLPTLTGRRRPTLAPFAVRLSRRCSAHRLSVRFTLGPGPEPLRRFEVTIPGRRAPITLDDPDGGGPEVAPVLVTVRLPPSAGTVSVRARDGLGRPAARATARLRACSRRGR